LKVWAGMCAAPNGFPTGLGFTHFCPNEPAVAGEMNANIQKIVDLVTQKVGTLGSANVTVAGTLSTNTITPASGSVVSLPNQVVVGGGLDIGAYKKACSSSPCFCNAVGENVINWSTSCANSGHGIYSSGPVVNGTTGANGYDVKCYNVGTGQVVSSLIVGIVCAKLTVN